MPLPFSSSTEVLRTVSVKGPRCLFLHPPRYIACELVRYSKGVRKPSRELERSTCCLQALTPSC